jgi:amino acid permease
MMPFPCETIYDLGYSLTRSRISVFFISILFIAANIGICITYLILFGDIMAKMVSMQLPALTDEEHFLKRRGYYVITLSILLTPLFFTKKIDQLTFVSIILTFAFIVGFVAFFLQLAN